MFDLNSVQFDDDDDSEGSGDEHSEIPARPRTSWDGTNYNRAQFFIQQQSTRRAIQPGAFPPPPQHPQARQFNAKGTQRPTGTPTNRCHCVSEDFYRGITENSELLTLINPSNAIGGEMRAIEQHKQNLSNNSSLFNSSDTTPLMANFSRITPFEDDDTISCSSSSNSNNNFNSGSSMERSGSGSPMFGRRNGGFNNDDNDCCQMRASRSSLDSSIQRRNFIQHYNAYMKGNPNYFALTKGSGILDSDSKVDGYLRLPRNMQQYGNPQNSQQQQQQQQHYQQSSQLQNQQTYKSGNTGNVGNVGSSLVNSNGYRWGYAYSVPSRSLNSSGVNSPYYDSYYSSGYASSLSGSSSSVVSEQNEVLDDPRELQKMKDDISRNSATNKHDVSEITAMLDNTHLSQKQQRHPHQRKLSLSSQTSSTSSMTSSFTSSSQFQSQLSPRSTLPQATSTTGTQKDQPLSPVTSSSSSSAGVVTSSSTNSSSPSPSSSGSSPLQRKQQLVIVKKKLVIQKPKSKTIQQSPLSQNNTNNITQNSDDNSDKPYDNNNSNSMQNVNSNEPLNNINNNPQLPLQQQQQPQKKKRKHRGGRRGTRVMREAKERKLASLREAKLLEESQQAAIINNNEGDDNDDDDDGDKEENDNETK